MIVIHDRASTAYALALDLTPLIRTAIEAELALLTLGEHDLTDWTDIVVVEPGDTEEAVTRELSFNPFIDPLSSRREGEPGFEPGWDYLSTRGDVFRLVFTFGSTHATILLVTDVDGVLPDLLALCRRHTV